MTAINDITATSASVDADGASGVSTPAELAEKQEPVTPDAPRGEVDRLDPQPVGPLQLQNGSFVEIQPMKLRETMKLLRIVTHGAGPVLEGMIGELDMDDPVGFAQTLGALILFSIPDAENEVIDFIQSMVLPAGFASMSNQEKVESLNSLAEELANPDLNDTVSIVEAVVRRESEDIRNLGKRITTAFKLLRKTEKPAEKS